jgi:predicted nucleic acid-binding protein
VGAFDSDVLIYAAVPGHELGRRVRSLFDAAHAMGAASAGVGSVVLIPELLVRPTRIGHADEARDLAALLSRIDLLAVGSATAELASSLGVAYGLRALDAVHLATAVSSGADRFITNNRRDFPQSITEVDVVYPADLPEA